MSLSVVIDAMVGAGCSPEQIAAVVRAYETKVEGEWKSASALRQARYRDRKRNATVTERNDSVTNVTPVSPPSPPIDNITLTPPTSPSVPIGARVQKPSNAILLALCAAVSADTALDVIAHRRAKKAPLTLRAAQLLAKGFLATGQPEAAAEMMIAQGWQGFKPDWFTRDTDGLGRNGKPTVQTAIRGLIARGIDFGPIPPVYMPERPSGGSGGNPVGLLPQGGRGGRADLRGSGGSNVVVLPAGDSGTGDRPQIGPAESKPMAADSSGGSGSLRSGNGPGEGSGG